MLEVVQVTILALVQGLTEFLPVSSSGHLILVPSFLGWDDFGLAFDAVVHLGTILAVIVYFRKDLLRILIAFFRPSTDREGAMLARLIIFSMIPAIIVGLTLKDFIETTLRTPHFVAFSLAFWGIILIIADQYATKYPKKQQEVYQLSTKQAITIGLAQAIALFPGTSRSGITVTAGLFSGLGRDTAVRFSFLMGVPLILIAGLLSLVDLLTISGGSPIAISSIFIALIVSFASGLLAIDLLLRLVQKRGLVYFGIYRILLAVLILMVL